MRNCIYRGELNTFLKSLAEENYFKNILGGLRNQRMEYAELALRFFALRSDFESYRPPLRQLLNTYMRDHQKEQPSTADILIFKETCKTVSRIFGEEAFRLPSKSSGKQLGAFNKALFDAIMLPLSFADRAKVIQKDDAVRKLRNNLIENEEFSTAIGRATADKSRMKTRTHAFSDGLKKIGIECALPQIPIK